MSTPQEFVQRNLVTLGERDALEVLRQTPQTLSDLFSTLDMSRGCELTPWTAGEIYCHLADIEVGYGFRIRQALAGTDELQHFDHLRWGMRYRNYESFSAKLALESFVGLRRWNVALLESLEPADWDHVTHHPERGSETLRLMIQSLAGHDLRHLQELEYISAYVEAG